MYQDFLAARITQLRLKKGVSALDMSLTLGQTDNYINHIENKKSLPSITSFFFICEFFNISPQEFFEEGNNYPIQLNDLIVNLKKLDEKALSVIDDVVKEFLSKK